MEAHSGKMEAIITEYHFYNNQAEKYAPRVTAVHHLTCYCLCPLGWVWWL
jgi:hypothetical protein